MLLVGRVRRRLRIDIWDFGGCGGFDRGGFVGVIGREADRNRVQRTGGGKSWMC